MTEPYCQVTGQNRGDNDLRGTMRLALDPADGNAAEYGTAALALSAYRGTLCLHATWRVSWYFAVVAHVPLALTPEP